MANPIRVSRSSKRGRYNNRRLVGRPQTGVCVSACREFHERRAFLRGLAAAVTAAGIAGTYWYLGRERAVPSLRQVAGPRAATSQPATRPALAPTRSREEIVAGIYQDSVVPLLAEFDARNAAAARRALDTLYDRIHMHRAGIPAFTRDVASWKTRFGVIGRGSADVWHALRHGHSDISRVSLYVNEKFRRYVISENALRADVAAALLQFNDDMQASRNRLYSDLALPLDRIKVAVPAASATVDEFRENVQRRATEMTRGMAIDTVVAGLAAVAGGWVATDVAQAITGRVVTQVLSQLGAAMAAEAVEAGGATVGGAAAGGGGGSLAGPIGAIIGLGVGLIVGAIVDWRLSSEFEQKVARQCEGFLHLLEYRLREGHGDSPGLRQVLQDAVNLTGRVQRDAVTAALKETW